MYRPCESNYVIDSHLIPFLQDCSFFAELSRHISKISTSDIPTIAIAYDLAADQVALYYNPSFMEQLTPWETRGVLTHEFYHYIFCHITARRKKPHMVWNIATDLAINSLIIENASHSRSSNNTGDERVLPKCGLVPGVWPSMPDGREMTKEEKESHKLGVLIATLPKLKASEWYYDKLMEFANESDDGDAEDGEDNDDGGDGKKKGKSGHRAKGLSGLDSFDDHDAWDSVPEEHRELIESKVKAIVEKAVKHADSTATGWGSIQAEMREEIRCSVSRTVDWRAVLRQFVGTLLRGGRTNSMKKINRKYPYIHPGTKRSYVAKLLVARDESGSVSNEMLSEFYGELASLTKRVEVDILPFDCHCDTSNIFRWKKGVIPENASKRTKGGGTDFNAPTSVFNDPKNRGRWDGLLVMTDGEAPAPLPCRAKRGWLLAKGRDLMFSTNELKIFISKDKPVQGAWR